MLMGLICIVLGHREHQTLVSMGKDWVLKTYPETERKERLTNQTL